MTCRCRRTVGLLLAWVVPAVFILTEAGPTAGAEFPILTGAVQCPAKIEWHLDPSVQVIRFSCNTDRVDRRPVIHYQLEVRNIGSSPQCYRVQIVNQGEPQSAEFYPLSGGPPAIDPGQEVKAAFTSRVRQPLVEELIVYVRSACP